MENLFLFIILIAFLLSIIVILWYVIDSILWWKYFINNANKFKINHYINGYYCFQWGDYFAFITPNKIVSIHNNKNNKCLLTGMNVIYSNKMYKELMQL